VRVAGVSLEFDHVKEAGQHHGQQAGGNGLAGAGLQRPAWQAPLHRERGAESGSDAEVLRGWVAARPQRLDESQEPSLVVVHDWSDGAELEDRRCPSRGDDSVVPLRVETTSRHPCTFAILDDAPRHGWWRS
jgi:hypothetical protein